MTTCLRSLAIAPRFLRSSPLALGLAAMLVLGSAEAAAQQSTTRGLSLGAQLVGTSLTVEDDDPSDGGGVGVRVGYGFNRIVTGFIHLDGSTIAISSGGTIVGDWTLANAEVGARFHFANSLRRWVPFLELSAGGRSVSVQDAAVNGRDVNDVSFSGGAVSVGGGLSAYVSRKLALDLSLKWTGGTFDEVDLGDVSLQNLDIDAASFRLGLGVVWWPRAR